MIPAPRLGFQSSAIEGKGESPFLKFSFSQVFAFFLKNIYFKKHFTQEGTQYESNSARRAVSAKSSLRECAAIYLKNRLARKPVNPPYRVEPSGSLDPSRRPPGAQLQSRFYGHDIGASVAVISRYR